MGGHLYEIGFREMVVRTNDWALPADRAIKHYDNYLNTTYNILLDIIVKDLYPVVNCYPDRTQQ